MFDKVLIANRGEIALRIIRACQELGVKTVMVHSTADSDSMPVHLADESVCIGGPTPKESYLNMRAIMSAADVTHVDAIHPGVGFLSENENFAKMTLEHGFNFIGPSPEHIVLMGDKSTAKSTMQRLGVQTIPGSAGEIESEEAALKQAIDIGMPVLIKASSGGGGKGMKVAYDEADVLQAYRLARTEAKTNFGRDQVYMEKYLETPRHIEFQIIADKFGHVVFLGERDCSVQRNHQKIWEEAPAPLLTEKQRAKVGAELARAIRKLEYVGVGTVEMLLEKDKFYFMEMNTRLQVEHTITEMVTGIDIVKEQIRVAAGFPLSFTQKNVTLKGHAIECRINAEDPQTFFPSPGTITHYLPPGGLGIRVDSHVFGGYVVPSYYDSMIGKLIAYGDTREECLARLRRALNEYVISGVSTIIPLHMEIAQSKDVIEAKYNTHWLENNIDILLKGG
ncbi:MAG: acetyl-CoA carboxylase biotin carboxylase subunit [Holosporales bacterium]|jgi:acetyl-CoA carboxylase biotin carboxylase subunit|nr:acetyl-CoA carboxylase biotin carboxylase subunit [Holosporales bacterium]